jgi:hypothetical protein
VIVSIAAFFKAASQKAKSGVGGLTKRNQAAQKSVGWMMPPGVTRQKI